MTITARSGNHTLSIFEVWGCLVLLNYRIHPNMATVTKLVAIGVIHTKVKTLRAAPPRINANKPPIGMPSIHFLFGLRHKLIGVHPKAALAITRIVFYERV